MSETIPGTSLEEMIIKIKGKNMTIETIHSGAGITIPYHCETPEDFLKPIKFNLKVKENEVSE